MAQININVTEEFGRALQRLMRARGLRSKSEAIRVAVQEAAIRATSGSPRLDFRNLVGLCCSPGPPQVKPRFSTDDALWEAD